jgi:glycogen synthase
MKIAFISYEYPPDTAFGGIATYVEQAVNILSQRGHYIEVFSGSHYNNYSQKDNQVIVHRIQVDNRQEFGQKVSIIFAQRYHQIKFDVLEAPEIGAEAAETIKLVPEIPLVVKLHTPSYIIQELSQTKPSFKFKLRRYLGALRRGKIPTNFPGYAYSPEGDIERLHTLQANEIATPSQAIANKLIQDWGIDSDKVSLVPLPYIPVAELLSIPSTTTTNVITFMGRLEIRKGILDLADAIPLVLKQFPDVKFRFVGSTWPLPYSNLDMQQYLERRLKHYMYALEFTGQVTLNTIPSWLADTDICVFPSLWESFGLVCLEAMAAARGVIGSSSGGMAELLNNDKVGKLVPPKSPKNIAKAVIELLENPQARMKRGEAARQRVLSEYSLDKIGALQEASYLRAIQRKHTLNSKNFVNKPCV